MGLLPIVSIVDGEYYCFYSLFILYSYLSIFRPCINHIPSMKQFHLVQPDDAEVLREGKWIRYDHASLVVGDIIRLFEVCVVSNCIAPFHRGNTHSV